MDSVIDFYEALMPVLFIVGVFLWIIMIITWIIRYIGKRRWEEV